MRSDCAKGAVSSMGLDKAINHGKEHRRQYRGVKLYCVECRNHGACDYCRNERLKNTRRRLEAMRYRIGEYKDNHDE